MLYLSDAIRGEYVQDEFNVVEAPCGCGKTEYAVNKLPYEILGSKPQFNRVLYLIDTCAGRHSIVAKHPEKARCYDNIIDNGGRRFDGFDANRIVVITYAKLGVEVRRNPDFLRQFDLIIADEFHNIHWPIPYERGIIKTNYPYLTSSEVDALLKERCNNYHAMMALSRAAVNPSTIVVGMSATPYDIETWAEWQDVPFTYMKIASNIRHYTAQNTVPYSHVDGLIKKLPEGQKTLFYAAHITDIKKFQKECETAGLRCASVWSVNNTDNPMTAEQLKIRNDIIESNEFPENVDVLFIPANFDCMLPYVWRPANGRGLWNFDCCWCCSAFGIGSFWYVVWLKRSVKHEKGKCNVSDRYGYIGCCTCWVYRRFYPNIHINSNVKEYLFK